MGFRSSYRGKPTLLIPMSRNQGQQSMVNLRYWEVLSYGTSIHEKYSELQTRRRIRFIISEHGSNLHDMRHTQNHII